MNYKHGSLQQWQRLQRTYFSPSGRRGLLMGYMQIFAPNKFILVRKITVPWNPSYMLLYVYREDVCFVNDDGLVTNVCVCVCVCTRTALRVLTFQFDIQ
jgi:hypothetical protein